MNYLIKPIQTQSKRNIYTSRCSGSNVEVYCGVLVYYTCNSSNIIANVMTVHAGYLQLLRSSGGAPIGGVRLSIMVACCIVDGV
jgi:hypothetical protein